MSTHERFHTTFVVTFVFAVLALQACSSTDEPKHSETTQPDSVGTRPSASVDGAVVPGTLPAGLPRFELLECFDGEPITLCDLVAITDGLAVGTATQVSFATGTAGAGCEVAEAPLQISFDETAIELEGDGAPPAHFVVGSDGFSQWSPMPYRINDAHDLGWAYNDRWPAVALVEGMQLVVPYLDTPVEQTGAFIHLPLLWITDEGIVQQESPCGIQVTDLPRNLDELRSSVAACSESSETALRLRARIEASLANPVGSYAVVCAQPSVSGETCDSPDAPCAPDPNAD